MIQALTRPRWTALLGLLALVAGVAALGLSSGPGTPAGLDPLPATAVEGGQGPSAPCRPAFCRGGPTDAPEALRPDHLTPTGCKLRPDSSGLALSAAGTSPKGQAPAWLCPSRARRAAFSRPPLQVLFCTWLA
jgi:hypothetical protein